MINAPISVLMIGADLTELYFIKQKLQEKARFTFQVETADGLPSALDRLTEGGIDIVLLDLSRGRGYELYAVEQITLATPDVAVVVLVMVSKEEIGIRAVQAGAQDYLLKEELDSPLLARALRYAVERQAQVKREKDIRAQAEQSRDLMLQFVGFIAHELRTPLTSIKGFASTLLANDLDFDPKTQRQFLSIIDEDADRLDELVQQLFDFVRLQVGVLSVEPVPQSLYGIVATALIHLQLVTSQHQLLIQVSRDFPLVLADEERIAQVLTNLVGNAAKFSPPQTTITISAHPQGEYIQVDVSDEGPGIPPAERENLFKAFHQGRQKRESKKQGAGLGLSICKSIVEAHGGTIWAQDRPQPGTIISFTLPLAPNDK